jgi:hypothetical protein
MTIRSIKIAKLLFPTIIAIGLVALLYVLTTKNTKSTENIGLIYRGQENLVLSDKFSKKMIFDNDKAWDEIDAISFEVGKSYGGSSSSSRSVHWSVAATTSLKSGQVRTANLMTAFKPAVEKITHDAITKEWKVYTNGREIEQTIEEAVGEAHSLALDGMTKSMEKSREEIANERRAEWQKASNNLASAALK